MATNNISKELLENVLGQHFKDKTVKILGLNLTPVVPSGDNYTSELNRATITFKRRENLRDETIKIILKSTPQEKMMQELGKKINLFEKEIHMFSKILPAINEILGDNKNISPGCYYVHDSGDNSILMLEDLKTLDFTMHERQNGMDLNHCLMVLDKLALFHAASVIISEKDRSLITNIFDDGLYCEVDKIQEWIEMSFKTCAAEVSRWPGFEKYGNRMLEMESKFFGLVLLASNQRSGHFNVLNHGDMWVNNMMFKYDHNGKLENMRFIDFQLSKFSSPAIDLHYFIATSPKEEVRIEYLDFMLDHYYCHLLYNLNKFMYPLENVLTRSEFIKDFKDRAIYGFVSALTVAPLVKAEHRSDANFESLMKHDGEGSFRQHCFTNDRYRKLLEQLLPLYDKYGVFD